MASPNNSTSSDEFIDKSSIHTQSDCGTNRSSVLATDRLGTMYLCPVIASDDIADQRWSFFTWASRFDNGITEAGQQELLARRETMNIKTKEEDKNSRLQVGVPSGSAELYYVNMGNTILSKNPELARANGLGVQIESTRIKWEREAGSAQMATREEGNRRTADWVEFTDPSADAAPRMTRKGEGGIGGRVRIALDVQNSKDCMNTAVLNPSGSTKTSEVKTSSAEANIGLVELL
ncbi:hypothetical protein P7C73_g6178, partial [Tremellales sp. Uapishka_1]